MFNIVVHDRLCEVLERARSRAAGDTCGRQCGDQPGTNGLRRMDLVLQAAASASFRTLRGKTGLRLCVARALACYSARSPPTTLPSVPRPPTARTYTYRAAGPRNRFARRARALGECPGAAALRTTRRQAHGAEHAGTPARWRPATDLRVMAHSIQRTMRVRLRTFRLASWLGGGGDVSGDCGRRLSRGPVASASAWPGGDTAVAACRSDPPTRSRQGCASGAKTRAPAVASVWPKARMAGNMAP